MGLDPSLGKVKLNFLYVSNLFLPLAHQDYLHWFLSCYPEFRFLYVRANEACMQQ